MTNILPRLALFLLLTAAAVCAHAAPPAELRIGYQKSSVNLLVARRLGAIERRFPQTRVKWVEFTAGPQLLEALGAHNLDFGMTGDTPPIFAPAAGRDILYVGQEPPKPRSSAILVSPDSKLQSLSDLRGKRVAFQKGSSAHYLVLRALAKAGLRFTDIQPIYLVPADARAVDTIFAALNEADHFVRTQQNQAAGWIAVATGLDPEVATTFLARRSDSPVNLLSPSGVAEQQAVADSFVSAGLLPKSVNIASAVWRPKQTAAR